MHEDLDQLREEVLQCKNCGLCATRNNVVFGVGAPGAKIMLVGEAPGTRRCCASGRAPGKTRIYKVSPLWAAAAS